MDKRQKMIKEQFRKAAHSLAEAVKEVERMGDVISREPFCHHYICEIRDEITPQASKLYHIAEITMFNQASNLHGSVLHEDIMKKTQDK